MEASLVVTRLPFPPMFRPGDEYDDRISDPGLWAPYVQAILTRHSLQTDQIEPGSFGTSPTFVTDRHVVKLFGHDDAWRLDHDTELAAHLLLADHPEIPAPNLVVHGRLYDEPEPWPYLVTERLPGRPWHDIDLPYQQRLTVAERLGEVVRHIHHLPPPTPREHGPLGRLGRDWLRDHGGNCIVRHREWGTLPSGLCDQIEDYVLPPSQVRSFVHADLAIDHIFLDGDQITGIIDWGGAEHTDNSYELPILYFDAFLGQKPLLRAFLAGYGGHVDTEFPRRAMTAALQHETDVFDILAAVRASIQPHQFQTLNDLAIALWDVMEG